MSSFKTLVLIFIVYFPMAASCQAPAPNVPDNVLTTADWVGLPPHASADGTSEAVSLGTGSLHMFIPAVTLPQRGGKPLVLGFSYDSTQQRLQQNIFAGVGSNFDFSWDYYTYNEEIVSTNLFASPLQVNLPLLQASAEYEGDSWVATTVPASQASIVIWPDFCLTNFAFTDWSGTTHSFPYATALCTVQEIDSTLSVNPIAEVLDDVSADGTHYLLHINVPATIPLPSTATITITAPDGTIYLWSSARLGNLNSLDFGFSQNVEQLLNGPPSSITDPNGNTISINQTTVGDDSWAYKITDTLQRNITVTGNFTGTSSPTIYYSDSNGKAQTVSLTAGNYQETSSPDVGSDLPWNSYCSLPNYGDPPPAPQYTFYPLGVTGQAPQTGSLGTLYLTYGSTGRIFTLQLDSLGHLIKIKYPSGGYTRYDYKENIYLKTQGPVSCNWGLIEVFHKYECPDSSGSCNQEYKTTYDNTYPPIENGAKVCPNYNTINGQLAGSVFENLNMVDIANAAMSVTDPLGTTTVHCFVPLQAYGPTFTPGETDTYIFDSALTPLKHVSRVIDDMGWPSNVTTTQEDVQPNLISKVKYYYDSYAELPSNYEPPYGGAAKPPILGPIAIENPTEIDEFDYANNLVRQTQETWFYTDHVLNRPWSKTITDPVLSQAETTNFTYDAAGNPHSLSRSGTNATTQSITGTEFDGYGRPLKVVDGLGYATKYQYTDNWGDSTCAPSSNSQSYLTTVTNPLSQTMTYQYNSCTGTLSSVIDANGKSISYGYDSLGRITSVTYPDSGWEHDTYRDSVPNTIQATKTQSPDPSITTQVVLDGYSRKSQTQLLRSLCTGA